MTPKYWSSNSCPLAEGAPKREATGDEQIGAGEDKVTINQEIFLLRSGKSGDRQLGGGVEVFENTFGLLVEGLEGAQQRGFFIQCLAGPGDKGGGNAEKGSVRVFEDIGRTGHVPGGVATGLKGGAQAAGGKGRCIRLTLDEQFAGEFGNGSTLTVGNEEGIVLLCGQAGQGVENVGKVGRAFLDGPNPSWRWQLHRQERHPVFRQKRWCFSVTCRYVWADVPS